MRPAPLKILILGGYGTFGGRLAQLLAEDEGLTLLIAGRSRDKAAAFAAGLPPGAAKVPVAFDRDGDVEAQLRAAAPDVVVDATGPFQVYGEKPYRVVEACLMLGIDYIDLADGRAFVTGIARFDEAARGKGIFALSGASTCPALTAAAVRHLSRDLAHVDAISGGIAPSPRAGVGLNVVRAIASYAGRPVPLVRKGREAVGYSLTEARRFTIRPPGHLPLRNIRFTLVDVPDLEVLPDLWPGLQSFWFGAGPRPAILHRLLSGLAWLVRGRLVPTLLPLASLFHRVIAHAQWGEHRGGMIVAVQGRSADGRKHDRSWHLVAERDDGPFIPAMPAAAILKRLRQGHRPPAGARPATGELEIGDFEPLFARKAIHTGCRDADETGPLYRRILGEAWTRLPGPLQDLHGRLARSTFTGQARVERGRGLLARLLAAVVGFPAAGEGVAVTVRFEEGRGGREIWRRTFAGRAFRSSQEEGRGRWEGLIVERFGPVAIGLALVLDGQTLRLVTRRWSFLGLPLPAALAPGGDMHETVRDGRFHFHVEIAHPLMGLIVRYQGWLEPQR